MTRLLLKLAFVVLLAGLTSGTLLSRGHAQSDELTLSNETLSPEIYEAIAERRYDVFIPLLKKYADDGNPEAAYRLANSYYYGTGVEKDLMISVEYYKISARAGFLQSQSELGMIYFSAEKYDEAFPLLLAAAQRGMRGRSTANLAHMFREGLGTTRDLEAGECWQRIAAKVPDGKHVNC